MRPRKHRGDLRERLAKNLRNFLKVYASIVIERERQGLPIPSKEQLERLEAGQPVIVTADKLSVIAPELMIPVHPTAPRYYVIKADGSAHAEDQAV